MKTRSQILGENLKRIRTEKNITRKQLAQKIGITEISFGKYERGERNLTADKIYNLATVLNVKVADILGENPQAQISDVLDENQNTGEQIFKYRLHRAYKMARDFLDYESNKEANFDDDGHIVIYSPKEIVYESNGVFSYRGGINAIAFKSADDFIKVMEKAEELALTRGIYFYLAFREIIFNETNLRVFDSDSLDKPLL